VRMSWRVRNEKYEQNLAYETEFLERVVTEMVRMRGA
jgi:hypothetical protein